MCPDAAAGMANVAILYSQVRNVSEVGRGFLRDYVAKKKPDVVGLFGNGPALIRGSPFPKLVALAAVES